MKILIFSDIHNSKKSFIKLQKYLKSNVVDLVIFCGDFTNSWDKDIDFVESIINYFKKNNTSFYAIPGNNDKQQVLDLLQDEDISLHMQYRKIQGYELFGIGGWANSDDYILKNIKPYQINPRTIFVTHIPPKFQTLDNFKVLPQLHIYGHKHKDTRIQTIRGCVFVQVPSIMNSKAAVIELPLKIVYYIDI